MSNIGFRVYTDIKRPSKDIIEKFKDIPVANIADNMGRISCVGTEIKRYSNVNMLGCAFTVKVAPGDNLMFHKALDMAKPGDVIVVDGEGSSSHSLCGEIMVQYAIKQGFNGFLINGCIRDSGTISGLNFSIYAIGVQPKGPYKNGPGEIGIPVCVGGIVIAPGDILVGDADGVVVIKPCDAEDVLRKAIAHNKMEEDTFRHIAAGTFDRSWVDKTLKEKSCEII
ncbi:MAG TPA: RraA family protein [Ruminiclostridium sp.]